MACLRQQRSQTFNNWEGVQPLCATATCLNAELSDTFAHSVHNQRCIQTVRLFRAWLWEDLTTVLLGSEKFCPTMATNQAAVQLYRRLIQAASAIKTESQRNMTLRQIKAEFARGRKLTEAAKFVSVLPVFRWSACHRFRSQGRDRAPKG